MSKKERADLLALRRHLHKALPLAEEQCQNLTLRIAELKPDLAENLLYVISRSTLLTQCEKALETSVESERLRLAELPWKMVTSSPIAIRAITEAAPGLLDEIHQRLAKGETWDSKRLRHRSSYLLRLLARGTVKTTPRGWFSHLALVQIGSSLDTWPIVGHYAANWTANIHAARKRLATSNELAGASISITGLHWMDEQQLYCWVVDQEESTTLREIIVKRTPALDAIRQALSSETRNIEELIDELLSEGATQQQRDALSGFIQYLVGLGILQLSTPPKSYLVGWRELTVEPDLPTQQGYIDVYRRATGSISDHFSARLENSICQAIRLGTMIAQEQDRSEHQILKLVTPTPKSVTEIIAEFLQKRAENESRNNTQDSEAASLYGFWPPQKTNRDTPYSRFLNWVNENVQMATEQIVVKPSFLDEIGAPLAAPLPWPVSCLVRPIIGTGRQEAALESISPAGIIDARFVDALSSLHGEFSPAAKYQAFLHKMAQQCDAECVELLVPSLSDQSANAVRRPRYTTTWTGDIDLATYRHAAKEDVYLPLNQILLHRNGDQIIAKNTNGKLLWPMYHATRTAASPWIEVIRLLIAASPARSGFRLLPPENPITAFPKRNWVPRIVLEGGTVLCPAQGRLTRSQLPILDLPLAKRAQALAQLRIDKGLPRWVFAKSEKHSQTRPLDLSSLAALDTFDKLFADSSLSTVILEEMLPDPNHFPTRDADHEMLATQLLVHFPRNATFAQLAANIATKQEETKGRNSQKDM